MALTARLFRMTIATHWYDQPAKRARSFEAHFKVARYGNISAVRRKLADKGVPFFQRVIRQRYGVTIPKGKMRVSFETRRTNEQDRTRRTGRIQSDGISRQIPHRSIGSVKDSQVCEETKKTCPTIEYAFSKLTKTALSNQHG